MSAIRQCPKCRGNIVTPAFEGDGAYPVEPMCRCDERTNDGLPRTLRVGGRTWELSDLFEIKP